MNPDSDLLRRSMAAEPAEWLDGLVIERVVGEVKRAGAPQRKPSRVRRWPGPLLAAALRGWLVRLSLSSVQLLWRGGDQRG